MSEIRQRIMKELTDIEATEGVRILYACESGSRAWGFPSKDSDYDVRFIYVRPVSWYLSITERRDVIERPIDDVLDVNGWDLLKALRLLRKCNPALLEWLQSPIIYMKQGSAADQLRSFGGRTFSPRSSMYHYLHMAKGNFRGYLQGEQVKLKKYLYVLRPLLACEWIERYNTMPPIGFEQLVSTLVPENSELGRAIRELLAQKQASREFDTGPRIEPIHAFIEQKLEYYEQVVVHKAPSEADVEQQLDELFHSVLRDVWGRGGLL
ncbi:nucleotidyltransferase domain-containing protein [Paenibacillus massiliensis]|uniref:nucleotidyltransferase domain-containing protein n=1 Tax=Paenibacillus massiliensis TaxID=225917 RepID=UPI000369B84F|nr:nucleotidyltransferase domain-containing protein [Paenibacillus massiliensis]